MDFQLRKLGGLFVVCLAMISPVDAATVTILDTVAAPGGLVDISVLVSGGEILQGAQINFAVHDPDNDAGVITIHNVTVGNIWAPSAAGTPVAETLPTSDNSVIYNILDFVNTAVANGVLATITLDLTNATPGGQAILHPEFNAAKPADTYLTGTLLAGLPIYEPTIVTGVLSILAPGIAGDYNDNGEVDAADYTVWRSLLGTNTQLSNEGAGVTPGMVTQEDYNTWKMNFGQASGAASGSGLSALSVAVPEPSALVLFGLAWPALALRRRRRSC